MALEKEETQMLKATVAPQCAERTTAPIYSTLLEINIDLIYRLNRTNDLLNEDVAKTCEFSVAIVILEYVQRLPANCSYPDPLIGPPPSSGWVYCSAKGICARRKVSSARILPTSGFRSS